jgi:hypothetical protein
MTKQLLALRRKAFGIAPVPPSIEVLREM